MGPDDGSDPAWPVLRSAVAALESGHWRVVLRPPGLVTGVTGPGHVVRRAVALHLVARSMQLQAQGRLHDAWERVGEAAALLPPSLVRRDRSTGTARAVLCEKPSDDAPVGVAVTRRTALLVWREQYELDDLRRTFAHRRQRPRDELVESCIQHLFWVEFDPFAWYRARSAEPAWADGTTVDRLRSLLCARGTELRRFANPTEETILSQAPWQDIGGYRGLCAEALDLLAARPRAAPWCGLAGTANLEVRRGRLRAWEYARHRRDDLER
jgi:hypothetical protein